MNALTFFVKLTVRELMDLQKVISTSKEQLNNNYITLEESTTCGLYDPWQGAGGLLDIELDKNVKLPLRFISSADIDGNRGYSLQETYGVSDDLWERNAIIMNSVKEAEEE